MDHLPVDLTKDDLTFGASVMWQVYCNRPLTDEDHARFVELYGCLGSTFLLVRAVKSLEVQLAAGNALVSYIPALRRYVIEIGQREILRALGTYMPCQRPMIYPGYRPSLSQIAGRATPTQPFAALKQARRARIGSSTAAMAAGKRFARMAPLNAKRVIGRKPRNSPDQGSNQE